MITLALIDGGPGPMVGFSLSAYMREAGAPSDPAAIVQRSNGALLETAWEATGGGWDWAVSISDQLVGDRVLTIGRTAGNMASRDREIALASALLEGWLAQVAS